MFVIFLLLLFIFSAAALISFDIPKQYAISVLAVFSIYISVSSPWPISLLLFVFFIPIAILLLKKNIRLSLFSRVVFAYVKKILPPMSHTEAVALKAGDVWLEADIFNGKPNWQGLKKLKLPDSNAKEKSFLENETNQLCALLDDWDIYQKGELNDKVWAFLKEKGFFGLIIPKSYDGLGFSANAHSEIVSKIATKSIAAAVTVMVPNSLGPAELLMHYGTDNQKETYLPKLATGEDIPCFALTSPTAGSDAGSISDSGVIFEKTVSGKKELYMRLNWNKRYITLAPVATLIGVAFKLTDPDNLLGDKKDLGITLALIPAKTKGVKKSKRHMPSGIGFMNGTTIGENVEVPISAVIGEKAGIGQGWQMLMECLSVGRSISLPALATAACKVAYRSSGAYARIRKQFKLPIGQFEGIQQSLARIGGLTYLAEATRKMTVSAVDMEIKPSLLSAITKHHLTEMARTCVNDAMDIHAGRAVQFGPSNYLGLLYLSLPVSITVEGANILTRSLMIFGQGALRCHPFLQKEMKTFQMQDEEEAIDAFDDLLMAHIKQVYKNGIDAFFHGLTKGIMLDNQMPEDLKDKAKKITLLSKNLSYCADVSFALLGGDLKRREFLSARLGDVLSYLYMATAAIYRCSKHPKNEVEKVHAIWAIDYCLYQAKRAFNDYFQNFPFVVAAKKMQMIAYLSLRSIEYPSDKLSEVIAKNMLAPSEFRDELTGVCMNDEHGPLAKLETAFLAAIDVSLIEKKMNEAMKKDSVRYRGLSQDLLLEKLLEDGLLSDEEVEKMLKTQEKVNAALAVDEF